MRKSNLSFSFSILFFIGFSIFNVEGGKTFFTGVQLEANEPIIRSFAMFKKGEAPSNTWPGKGESRIDINLEAKGEDSHFYVVTLHSSQLGRIGILDKQNKVTYCCTNAIAADSNAPGCDVGDLFIHDSVDGKLLYRNQTKNVSFHLEVPETGLWYIYIVNCGLKDKAKAVIVNGEIDFMNPFGYLNGEWWYNMPFFLTMMLVYFLVFIWWVSVSIYHRRQLLQLQNWIGIVFLCALVENAALYFAYLGFNNIGMNYIGAMIVGTLVSSLKKTLSRVLILVVCMGYGVVKPTLGTTSYKVGLLGFFYFLFSSASYVTSLVHKSGNINVSDSWNLLLVLPTSILDTWFYWWTLSSLIRTITLLQERKQPIKLAMYKKFFVTLIGLACALCIIILSETIVMFATTEAQTWKVNWIWDAFFEIIYFVISMTVAIIWRPINNNTRYAYNEVDSNDGDVEQVMLSNINNVQQRKVNRDKDDEGDESRAAFSIDEEHA
eukprot:TRINITY_DN11305_c0_g1_i1.p1 TRINITY_DN11305_c0_g1~~TRINITY_DN11305_c0_g1_i1.p1  ORF type:complete len:492 (-),score=106.96 TRINITY_DN11305_c0_g1_i1:160-1635(-)